MKICVIGGTGHIGGFLVASLVKDGQEVTVVTSGRHDFPSGGVWDKVARVTAKYVRDSSEWLGAVSQIKCDVLIDILGADLPGIYSAVKGSASQVIVCGSVWMFGTPKVVPVPEETQSSCEFPGYARRYEEMLRIKAQARVDGVRFTAVMPPNISGPGKIPLDLRGGRSVEVHRAMATGKAFRFPESALANLIGPCDAEDVAQGFFLAACQPDRADGEIFNVGSAHALTLRQLIAAYEAIYETKIPVEIIGHDEFFSNELPEPGANFHFRAHMCPDISKIRSKLGYRPLHTPEESLARAVSWMRYNVSR